MFREKLVSYRISVTPPSMETLMNGRRRRAKAASKTVEEDLASARERLDTASIQKVTLETEISKLLGTEAYIKSTIVSLGQVHERSRAVNLPLRPAPGGAP